MVVYYSTRAPSYLRTFVPSYLPGRYLRTKVRTKRIFGFFSLENFKRFLTPYGQLHSEARGRRAIPQANSLILPEACQDSEMSENEVVGKSWTWTSLRARRHRVLPNLDREWYHVMAPSASIRYIEQVLQGQHVLKLSPTVGRGASTWGGLPLT